MEWTVKEFIFKSAFLQNCDDPQVVGVLEKATWNNSMTYISHTAVMKLALGMSSLY